MSHSRPVTRYLYLRKVRLKEFWLALPFAVIFLCLSKAFAGAADGTADFPPPLASYPNSQDSSLAEILLQRVKAEPFNVIATLFFFLAIAHTFAAPMFLRLSHRFEAGHRASMRDADKAKPGGGPVHEVSFKAEIFHFLGEVEAVFGIWVIPLVVAMTLAKGWVVARSYLTMGSKFTEALFVVVVMTIAASRPILKISENLLALFARLGKASAAAWWFSIMTVGPILGSFITEPAAMTISALLLAEKFYSRKPSQAFAYATLGCLFVNVSVGGTLTHFAAPPVLMVAGKWGWGLQHMMMNFGWKAAAGILLSNAIFYFWFKGEFARLQPEACRKVEQERDFVPAWITSVHLLFLAWTVLNNHFPVMFIGAFLFYLAFVQATEHHQAEVRLRPPLLVGFFLAGLVVHGGLQGWWIQPVLSKLGELPLFIGAVVLTAFNDNAAITYLASLVPSFSEPLKHAVVAGAVVGGGLTVIANAPNPAGQSILATFFPDGVSPLRLFLGAIVPTLVTGAIFLIFRV